MRFQLAALFVTTLVAGLVSSQGTSTCKDKLAKVCCANFIPTESIAVIAKVLGDGFKLPQGYFGQGCVATTALGFCPPGTKQKSCIAFAASNLMACGCQ